MVEILIALVLFGIAAAGTAPLLIKALDATQTGKLNTQAKNLLQQRVESMRNLPYHVATSAGPYIDLLDTYFRDATGAGANTACSSVVYRSAAYAVVAERNSYVCRRTTLALPGFTEEVRAQFVDQNGAVIVPISTYNSQSATNDVPVSNTLKVTVVETWTKAGKTKTFSTTTSIGSASTGTPQIVAQIRDSVVSIATTLDDSALPRTVQFDGGLINASAGLSTGATANALLQSALTTYSSGETSAGQASGYLDAPPDVTAVQTVSGAGSSGAPCAAGVACFGAGTVTGITGTASNGVPRVGTAAVPLKAYLAKSGAAGTRGFAFGNAPTGSVQNVLTRIGVQQAGSPPTAANPTQLVRSVQGASNAGYDATCTGAGVATSSADFLAATGYITSTGGAVHAVTSCATATSRRIDIMPTSFAPNGVVQVTLDYAGIQCNAAAGATGTVSATFRGSVVYTPYGGSPVTVTFQNGQATSPLTPALLTKSAATGGVKVGVDGSGNPLWLGDYVQSWGSGALSTSTVSQAANATLRAFTLTTVPTRDADTIGTSRVNLTVGSMTCEARDNR